MLRSRRLWLGTIVSFIFILMFLLRVDLSSMWDSLKNARYIYLIPAISIYFISVFFRTLRWKYLLRPITDEEIGMVKLYRVVVVGYMANNILPVRLGEFVRSYYLGRKMNVSATSTLATIVIERVFDGLVLLFFLLITALSIPMSSTFQGLGDALGVPWVLIPLGLSIPFLIAIGILFNLAHFSGRINHFFQSAPPRLRERLVKLASFFIQGLLILRSPKQISRIFLLSLPIWLSEALMYLLVGYSFGLNEVIPGIVQIASVILLVTAVANLSIAFPSSPGGIGPFEFFTLTILLLVGVHESIASAYALALHATVLVPVTILGFIVLWLDNLSLGQLYRQRAD